MLPVVHMWDRPHICEQTEKQKKKLDYINQQSSVIQTINKKTRLDILTDLTFTIHFRDCLVYQTHIFHETTTPIKSKS